MNIIDKLEKRFGSWAIPNLAIYLIAIQAIGVVLLMGGYAKEVDLILHGSSVVDRGEWWRLLSFMMMPKTLSPIWLFFAFYIFYLMGHALEERWGAFHFNLFILCGYLLTVLMAFISPGAIITNTYFLGCVFMAFATLFPNVEFRLFFILPVKVKWLGWLTVGAYVLTLFSGDAGSRLCVLAAFINYGLFFGKALVNSFKAGKRRKAFQSEQAVEADQPRHVCAECGATDKSDPALDFRYCSTCAQCFCEKHISSHEHT
ncbi:hypothetical protein [Pontiella sulfatireligans]|uniref:Peptidase S54 rhomboid domain-containing protein n=1 Tax=Pontiella sulfatireligans TaxID=2750658 RepID=A0A6C2UF45_9BACT|nr:hypothetical protein [Pontiella sulfatireligans]VGO17994.1 hypothetical protein SCARR_00044 [Pontiella sulfatireligans]